MTGSDSRPVARLLKLWSVTRMTSADTLDGVVDHRRDVVGKQHHHEPVTPRLVDKLKANVQQPGSKLVSISFPRIANRSSVML